MKRNTCKRTVQGSWDVNKVTPAINYLLFYFMSNFQHIYKVVQKQWANAERAKRDNDMNAEEIK